jgi:outer membrane lipopolysaccharide assembly protein LptE/RlpB
VAVTLACLLSFGCGYRTAGHSSVLPEDIKTVAIPSFTNQTDTFKVEQLLTAAVVREWTTRTNYRVVNEQSNSADATLRGTVLSSYASPATYDSQTGRAASVLVVVSMKVSLTDRQGKVLFENPYYVFREQYQVSREVQSFFEEDSPALRRLSDEFAHTLVSNILEGF